MGRDTNFEAESSTNAMITFILKYSAIIAAAVGSGMDLDAIYELIRTLRTSTNCSNGIIFAENSWETGLRTPASTTTCEELGLKNKVKKSDVSNAIRNGTGYPRGEAQDTVVKNAHNACKTRIVPLSSTAYFECLDAERERLKIR